YLLGQRRPMSLSGFAEQGRFSAGDTAGLADRIVPGGASLHDSAGRAVPSGAYGGASDGRAVPGTLR
ncbi:MAG TPA: hypothetical protein VHF22_15930, partial [Planctomycetota bacterium]|nr:hypothetical protein [Planctomycetota bacterium]